MVAAGCRKKCRTHWVWCKYCSHHLKRKAPFSHVLQYNKGGNETHKHCNNLCYTCRIAERLAVWLPHSPILLLYERSGIVFFYVFPLNRERSNRIVCICWDIVWKMNTKRLVASLSQQLDTSCTDFPDGFEETAPPQVSMLCLTCNNYIIIPIPYEYIFCVRYN